MQPATVLSIAGSDSGGGAGLQADLRTFAALGVHGTTAVTALTAQNTLGVQHVAPSSVESVQAQIESVLRDFSVAAVKTGMLATPEIIALIGEYAARGALPWLVVDPVFVSTTNHALVSDGGVAAYRQHLLPHAFLVTPNLREAAALCDLDLATLTTTDALIAVGASLCALGAKHVLVKGGHFPDVASVPDVLVSSDDTLILEGPRVPTTNDHGTGCTLSAAIATFLAGGDPPAVACRRAKDFVTGALRGGANWRLGAGAGPLDHMGWNQ